jgi:hypothetical protein
VKAPVFQQSGTIACIDFAFLPFPMFAVIRRQLRPMLRGVWVFAFVGAAALIVVHIRGARTAALGDSFESLVANHFACHLLWYLAIFLLLLRRRRRWSIELSVAGTTLGLGATFLAAVFWGTDLSASIANATTLNRAILPLGPATCFFLAPLTQPDVLRLAGTPARPPARKTRAGANGSSP